jgi:hypothetical protein
MPRRESILAIAFSATLLSASGAGQEVTARADQTVLTRDRFAGEVRLDRASGAIGEAAPATGPSVEVRNWSLAGGSRIEDLGIAHEGFALVELRAGELTTIIDGRRDKRLEGAFWTVPPGARMGLETGDDVAVIQTIVIVGTD